MATFAEEKRDYIKANLPKAVKMQIICTIIMVITAAITLAGFLGGIKNG